MNYVLDEVDKAILNILQENALIPIKELSQRLHRSVSPIQVRIRRLEQEGFIKNYTAILNPKKIGRQLAAFVHVKVKEHTATAMQAFAEAASLLEEVSECYKTSGPCDFLLKVVTKDLEDYDEVLKYKILVLPNVGNIESTLVLAVEKINTTYKFK